MYDEAVLDLVDESTRDVLDDALRFLALGYSAEQCAKQFPEHTDQLFPLLLVMEALLELRVEDDAALQAASQDPIDWHSLCTPHPVT